MDKKIQKYMEKVYFTNYWGSPESRSGTGSEKVNTQYIEHELPYVINKLGAKSVLDIPCGDFAWMKRMLKNLPEDIFYHGADIVEEIVEVNKKHTTDRISFSCLDITSDKLPYADIAIVRDCLNHLPLENIFQAINNLKLSGIKYVAMTNFNWRSKVNNDNINNDERVKWRRLNFTIEPFMFDNPIDVIVEGSLDGRDKTLAIWKVSDIPAM
jgi:2-polyprenyl-3-methyl-5-hydroxy-6-metoxy-1,4-benzoquinol methylase